MRNKRGVELSMNVVIIAILVILVLIVVSIFFLGGIGNITSKIREIFGGSVKGTDIPLAIEACKTRCSTAEQTGSNSVYCGATFRIDADGNGYADYEDEETKKYRNYHCYEDPLNVACPDITCSGQ